MSSYYFQRQCELPNNESPIYDEVEPMNVYEIDDGEQWWYAAVSKEDALRQYVEPLMPEGTDLSNLQSVFEQEKYMLPCPWEEISVEEVPADKELSVTQEDGKTVIKKTAAEWAADGPGLIAATVW